MLEGRERGLQDVEPLLRQVSLVAVVLQPFDEFLLRGNVVLGFGGVPIHRDEVYQFAIAVGGGVAACLTRSAAVCHAGAWNPAPPGTLAASYRRNGGHPQRALAS
jgi:hypothetical protein